MYAYIVSSPKGQGLFFSWAAWFPRAGSFEGLGVGLWEKRELAQRRSANLIIPDTGSNFGARGPLWLRA